MDPHVSPARDDDVAVARRAEAAGEDDTTDPMLAQRRLIPGLEGGWLCFENAAEKRRLNPIPESWERLGEPDLEGLLSRAKPVRRRSD